MNLRHAKKKNLDTSGCLFLAIPDFGTKRILGWSDSRNAPCRGQSRILQPQEDALLMSKKEWVPAGVSARLLDSDELTNNNRHELLEQLRRETNEALVNYVYGFVRSRDDARDIVQEAYIRLYRIRDLNAVGHLRSFLFKVAKNLATDVIRKRIVRETFADEEPLRANHESPSPEHVWLAMEELQALERAIERLPPRTQTALMLMRIDGLTYEELAPRLGIKTHSARRLIERAMEYLLEATSEESIARERRQ
jgi:RNA polymerase sigma factor (sigma-70 family)